MERIPLTTHSLNMVLEAIAFQLEEKAKKHMDSDVINRMERAKVYRELVEIIRSAKS